MNYGDLLAQLGFPERVRDAYAGKIEVPNHSLVAPFNPVYGFPPIIIPLWSDGAWPGYIGAVTDWFECGDHGFVQYYSSDQYASEIALTFDQLKVWLTFDFLCNVPDTNEVGAFAQSIGLCPKDDVETYFANCKDFSDLKRLEEFKSNLPSILLNGARASEPGWIQPATSKENVLALIEKGEIKLAWHSINSPGLEQNDIVELLEKISHHSKDKLFGSLVDCWVNANEQWG